LAKVLWQASFPQRSSRNRLYYPQTGASVVSRSNLILEPSTAISWPLAENIRLRQRHNDKEGSDCYSNTRSHASKLHPRVPSPQTPRALTSRGKEVNLG
jgi:hypothetical protein